MDFKEKAQGYFKSYASVNEFYFTGDGMAFFADTDAECHAKSLSDKTVVKVLRSELEEHLAAKKDEEAKKAKELEAAKKAEEAKEAKTVEQAGEEKK